MLSAQAICVVVTGMDHPEESQQCRLIGIHGYVAKLGLDGRLLARVLKEISENEYSTVLSHAKQSAPAIRN